uniref:Uncharacterized protein n=1 Tax=Graphocephala atropunctata TaxID=36148 RepID=A0A1B6LJR4_9HEMI
MENYTKRAESSLNGSQQSKRTSNNDKSQYSSHTEGVSSSAYTVKSQNASFNTSPQSTDIASSDMAGSDQSSRISAHSSRRSNKPPKESIRLMPVKVKDIMKMFNNNPAYRDKSPVMINMKENDIDQIIEQQRSGNFMRLSASQQQPLRQSGRGSPMSMRQSEEEKFIQKTPSPISYVRTWSDEMLQSSRTSSKQAPGLTNPPLGEAQTQQVYAMNALPVGSAGFRAQRSRKRTPQARSRRISPVRRPRSRRPRSRRPRPRRRPISRLRSRSRRRKSRPMRTVRTRPRRRSPVVVVNKRRYPTMDYCCNTYPMCDNTCNLTFGQPRYIPSKAAIRHPVRTKSNILVRTRSRSANRPIIKSPMYSMNRPRGMRSGVSITCDCNLCVEKLQFIQPGVCSKRKHMWTNEYAIIPKKQINLIDPCEELDPLIYPRADNPCIRDGHGNPLTDCIGRPLRDPVGKKFLNFTANGSVMDTNIRGNFYTGQPPLCVKCPLPTNTCAPDATHNWWMSCGYPVEANMNPFFKQILANDHFQHRI